MSAWFLDTDRDGIPDASDPDSLNPDMNGNGVPDGVDSANDVILTAPDDEEFRQSEPARVQFKIIETARAAYGEDIDKTAAETRPAESKNQSPLAFILLAAGLVVIVIGTGLYLHSKKSREG